MCVSHAEQQARGSQQSRPGVRSLKLLGTLAETPAKVLAKAEERL